MKMPEGSWRTTDEVAHDDKIFDEIFELLSSSVCPHAIIDKIFQVRLKAIKDMMIYAHPGSLTPEELARFDELLDDEHLYHDLIQIIPDLNQKILDNKH